MSGDKDELLSFSFCDTESDGPALTLHLYSETGLLTSPSWPWIRSVDHTGRGLQRPFLACDSYISLLKWQSTSGTAPCCLWLWYCSGCSEENQPGCQPSESWNPSLSLIDLRKYNSKCLMRGHFWPSAVQGIGSGNPRPRICCYLRAFSWMTFSSGLQVNEGWPSVLTLLLKTHINLKNLDDNCFHSDCERQTFLTPKWSETDTVVMFSFLSVWRLNLSDHTWILLWLTYGNEENNHLVLVPENMKPEYKFLILLN